MSFGAGPFGAFPAGEPMPPQPEEVRSALSSSRGIAFSVGRYQINQEGGFEAIDDIAQTVALTVAYAYQPPKVITPQSIAETRSAIAAALRALSSGVGAVIADVDVIVESPSPGRLAHRVTYRNLMTGTKTTIQPRP